MLFKLRRHLCKGSIDILEFSFHVLFVTDDVLGLVFCMCTYFFLYRLNALNILIYPPLSEGVVYQYKQSRLLELIFTFRKHRYCLTARSSVQYSTSLGTGKIFDCCDFVKSRASKILSDQRFNISL